MSHSRSVRFPVPRLKELLRARPFAAADWQGHCAPFMHLRIGNGPVATDRDASLSRLSDFLGRTRDFGGSYCEIWQQREMIAVETEVEFLDAGGAPARLPCMILARTTHGLIQDLRFYLDPSPIP